MVPSEDIRPNHAYAAWADALLSNRYEAMSDILEGRGSRGALHYVEPGDYLADLLAQPALRTWRDALVEAIDVALIEWMKERATWPSAQVARFGTRAYAAQFSDALAAVARLPLMSSPWHLLDDVGTWDDRFRSMRWPNDIDLLRQFDLALAQHQPDDRLTSRWFASCEEAAWAGPYWRDTLGIALVGLRKIPDPTTTQPERLVATALARFAALSSQRSTDSTELRTEFRRHVSTLAVLYPRHHSRWKETWASALASLRGFRHHRAVAQDEWLRPALPSQCFPHIDHARNVPARRNWTQAARRPAHLPPKTEFDAVVDAVDTTQALDDALWRSAHSLLSRHWAYARYTHNSHYAVRTTHNVCDRLLRKDPSEAQLGEIHSWTLRAMRAENGDPYIWDLWAKVLAVAGADETSLDVRWEAVRRFPDNLVTRMAMIVALAGNGRRELAEHLFNETSEDFPNEVIEPRLLQAHRWSEAASAMSTRCSHDPLAGEFRRVIEDEQYFNGTEDRYSSGLRLDPHTHVLESLSNRAVLLQRYFAQPHDVSVASEMAGPEAPTSELELVTACRTEAWPQQGEDILESWLNARPASYSLHLLALSRGINGHGADPEQFSQLKSAFPQHHRWNQWLGYPFADPDERTRLRQEARSQGLWGGRLSAVYPDLGIRYGRPTEPNPGPLRRLFEDVALANADAGLIQI